MVPGSGLQPHDISFKLGPRINASGRLADAATPIKLLLSEDDNFCKEVSLQLNDYNSERQRIDSIPAMAFIENDGSTGLRYPANPNGSPDGLTAFTTADGRATILMPHPERVFRSVQMSWRDPSLGEDSPWMRVFRNARAWLA